MSTTIDNKVVEMRFDNKHFESNVSKSLSSIQKLKQSLNFKGAEKGFENLEAASKKIDFSKVESTACQAGFRIRDVWLKVSEVFEYQVARKIIAAAENMAKALTIDPVKSGFSEYETQINAVQTILANTSSKGKTLDDVNAALDELNKYADKTIYNFTEMTRNIGTFTAAGVDLDTSVAAIKGIANLAAVSGSTSQQASTAMYQLSQALASGTVKLMDWNSVVNAGMGGQVFQDALKETARVHGIAIDTMIEQEGSFRETLSNGWLSSEILTETLSKFTGDLNEAQLKTMGYTKEQIAGILKMGQTANDAATKVKTFTQLFDTLKEAAQSGWTQTWEIIVGDFDEAKALFTEVSDVFGAIIGKAAESRNALLGGALGSKWSQLRTQVTSTGIEFEDFQEKLKETAKSHGVSIDEMIEKEGSLEKTLKNGWLTSDIISETLRIYTDGASEATRTTEQLLDKGIHPLTAELYEFKDIARDVLLGKYGNGEERFKALTAAGYDYAKVQKLVNYLHNYGVADFYKLSEAQLKNIGFTEEQIEAINELAKQAEEAGTPLSELIATMEKPSGRELLIDTFRNVLISLGRIINSVKTAWTNMFPPMTSDQLYGIIEAIHTFSTKLVISEGSADKLRRTFEGLLAIVKIITTITGGAFKIALKILGHALGLVDVDILSVAASVGDAVVAFEEWLFKNNIIAKAINKLTEIIGKGIRKLAEWIAEFKSLPWVQKAIEKVKTSFIEGLVKFKELLGKGIDFIKNFGTHLTNGTNKVKEWINQFMALPKVQAILQKFKNVFSGVFSGLGSAFKGSIEAIKECIAKLKSLDKITFKDVGNALVELKDKVFESFKAIGGNFTGIKDILNDFKNRLKSGFTQAGESIETFGGKVVDVFKKIKDVIGEYVGIGEILTVVLGLGMINTARKIGKAFDILSAPLEGTGGILLGISELLGDFRGLVKSAKLVMYATAFTSLAKAVLMLAAAVVVLTFLDQGKVWSAVGAMTVLMGALVGLAFAITKIASIKSQGLKGVVSLISIAAAVLILAIALKTMDSLDGDKILRNVLVLAGIMAALVGASIALSKFAPQLSKGSLTLIGFAIAVKLLVGALEDVTEVTSDNIEKSLLILLGAMGGLALVAAACKNIKIGAALTVIAIALALKILIKSFDDIAALDTDKMASNLGAFITIFGMFAVLMASSHLAGKNAAKAGIAIIGMSVALAIIVLVLNILSKIDPGSLAAPLAVVGALMTLFAGIIAVSALAGDNALKAGVMLLMMAGAIAILSVVIAILSKLDPDGLTRAVGAIAALELCFALLIGITKLAKNCVGTLVILTVAIGILAVALGALAMINPDNLTTATIAISSVIAMFALLVATTAVAKKASLTLILITAIVAVLAGILYVLAGLPVESTLGVAASLSILLLALSASCVILAGVGSAGPSAFLGIGVLAALIVAIGALMVGIGALMEYCPQLESFIDRAIPILEKIGYGLGSFIGSIVGGLAAGVMSGLPAIADSLSTFMIRLQPFIDGARTIDGQIVESIASLVGVILMLTAADLISGITSFLTGGSSIGDFAAQLPLLGQGIADFSNTVSGKVDEDAVQTAANAGKILTELAKTVPNSGGLLGFFMGENDIGTFAAQLPTLGEALVDFSTTVRGRVDEDAVQTAANAGKILTDLAKTVPNSGGLVGFFAGENDIGAFAEQLPTLGLGLVAFSMITKGNVNEEAVEIAVNAGKMLTDLATTIPNSGGLVGFFAGENNISAFATQLPVLGMGLVSFSLITKGNVDEEAVTTAVNAGKMLTDLANTIPNSGGLISFFTGDNSMTTFAAQLPILGGGLVAFSTIVNGNINADAVKTASDAGKTLSELSAYISESKTGGLLSFIVGGNMTTFAAQLPILGGGIALFSAAVDGKVNAAAIETAANAGQILVNLDKSIPKSNAVLDFFTGEGSKMKKFKEQMPLLGEAIVAFSDAVSDKVSVDEVNAATNSGLLLSELAGRLTGTKNLVDFLDNDGFSKFSNQFPKLGDAIASFSSAVNGKVSKAAVQNGADAGDIIVNLSDRISGAKSGSLLNFLNNYGFTKFATQLPLLGECIAGFSSNVDGKVSVDAVKAAANAGDILLDLSEKISDTQTGGFIDFIADENTPIKDFADQLPHLADGIVGFSGKVKGDAISDSAVQKAVNAGDMLASLADKISDARTGGFISFIANKSTPLQDFADQIPKLGEGIANFSAEVKDKVDGEDVTAAGNALAMMSTIVSEMPTTGGFWNWIVGKANSIDRFKEKLPVLGEGIAAFSETITGRIDTDSVAAAGNVADILVKLASNIDDELISDLDSFSFNLPNLATAMTAYYAKVTTIDAEKLDTSISQVYALAEMAKALTELDSTGMTGFGTALQKMAKNGITDFTTVFNWESSTEKVKDAAKKMLSDFVNGGIESGTKLRLSFKSIMTTVINTIEGMYKDFKDAGKYLVEGVAKGVEDNAHIAIAKAEAMAKDVLAASRRAFGINSPSKEFYEMGRFSVLGFTNALDDYGDKAADAGSNLAESAKTGLSNAISRITDIISGNIDTQPTIRPVLDLTNVESGTRRLNTLFSRTQALTISAGMNRDSSEIQNGETTAKIGNTYQFTQNNYSPKALSRVEIYRQTKNQFSAMERMVEA